MKQKLTIVFSNLHHSTGMEWMADHLNPLRYDVEYIFLNPYRSKLQQVMDSKKYSTRFIQMRGKKDFVSVFFQLCRYFIRRKPHIVHAHLFEASLLSLPAAWLCGIRKRIHTRHHSSLHHTDHPHVVKYDRLINFFSTAIIAVSENVAGILRRREGVNQKKIFVIHHGFDLKQFERTNISLDRIALLRKKYQLTSGPVIGVVSRFVQWKGIQYIIPAFSRFLADYPETVLILANAGGNYKVQIDQLLNKLPPHSYRTIEHESDIFALYCLFDVFVHVPVRPDAEAFGQVYVEALASGVSMICTLSGVGTEIVKDGYNALVVDYCNEEAIYAAMKRMLSDEQLASDLKRNAMASVSGKFTLEEMMNKLEQVYG